MKYYIKIVLYSFLISVIILILGFVFSYELLDSLIMSLFLSGAACMFFSNDTQLKFKKVTRYIAISSALLLITFLLGVRFVSLPLSIVISVTASCFLSKILISESFRKKIKINFKIEEDSINNLAKFSLIFFMSFMFILVDIILISFIYG